MSYAPDGDPLAALARPDRGNVSVYARNRDYHDVVKGRLKHLAAFIVSRFGPAGSGDPRTSAPDDRASWDRGAWQRYLDAAVRLEAGYGPRMRRLREDIARLERLLDLSVAA